MTVQYYNSSIRARVFHPTVYWNVQCTNTLTLSSIYDSLFSMECIPKYCLFHLRWTRLFCSLLFTVSTTGGSYRKPYSTLVLKLCTKKVYSWISFCGTEKREEKTRQKLEPEEDHVHAQKPRLKLPFKNTISVETKGYKARTGTTLVSTRTEILPLVSSRHCCHRNWRFEVSKKYQNSYLQMNKYTKTQSAGTIISESRLPNHTVKYLCTSPTMLWNSLFKLYKLCLHPLPFPLLLPPPLGTGDKT